MNDQVVELHNPGLYILLCSPLAVTQLEEGGDYMTRFPDGKDMVDYINECRLAAIATRWPQRPHRLHFSSTMDPGVISRASDHVRLGIEVWHQQLCVRSGDDLFAWRRRCPEDQLISVADGLYAVTACMIPSARESEAVRIYLHLAPSQARPELGYSDVPLLYGESPVC